MTRGKWRVVIAISIAAGSGLGSWLVASRVPANSFQDFAFLWFAARAVLRGQDPYQTVLSLQGSPLFFYPLPAALAAIPFTVLPLNIAGPAFVALSFGLLAYVVTARSWWPLLMFLSGSALLTIVVAQVSALLTAAVLVPSLSWIGVFKPNVGVALLAYRPARRTLILMIGITVASFLVQPNWLQAWISNALSSPYHFAPWRSAGGFVLLTAALKWRRPEARLLTALALVPSSPIVYEAFPLFVVPRTRLEMLTLAVSTNIVFALMATISLQRDRALYLSRAEPAMVWLAYMPALLMVLRRPNCGSVPAWLERIANRAPRWLAGKPASDPQALA